MNSHNRLTDSQKKILAPLVKRAQLLNARAAMAWRDIGRVLDEFGSGNHSQCCPIGGMMTGGRNGMSGTTPCPCGWQVKDAGK